MLRTALSVVMQLDLLITVSLTLHGRGFTRGTLLLLSIGMMTNCNAVRLEAPCMPTISETYPCLEPSTNVVDCIYT